MPVPALPGPVAPVALSDGSREPVVLRHAVERLRTVGAMVPVGRRAAARVTSCVGHTRVPGRAILVRRAVARAFRPPLQPQIHTLYARYTYTDSRDHIMRLVTW